MPNEGGGGYGGLGSGGNYQKLPKRGSGRSLSPQRYTPPPQRPQPISRPTREQAPSRPAPRPKPKPVSRPAASREQRPNAVAVSPANRIALLQRVLSAYSPPPSPDRTTGREKAGFSSEAFTGKAPRFVDEANGFFPDASGAVRGAKYGLQAGNPKQQALAAKDAAQEKRNGAFALRQAASVLGASPIGQVAGDIQANRTWAKLAPLFGRDPSKPPPTTFGDTGKKAIGTATGQNVKLDPSLLSNILLGGKGVAKTAAHEYSHTQQNASGYDSGGKGKIEGGARAFEDAVAPLLGYKPSKYGGAKDAYGNWAAQYFHRGGGYRDPVDLRKTLIQQFPRVKSRMGQ